MSGIPLGIAISAGIAASGGPENGIAILRACECSYEAPIRQDEEAIARATVTGMGKRHVETSFEVFSADGGRLLMRGKLVLVRVGENGRAADITSLLTGPESA